MTRFAGKVAVVTGAAQGIGREAALRLAAEGAHVVLADRSELVHEAAAEANGMAVMADMERYEDCAGLMRQAVGRHGRIDILVNNVGGTIWAQPFADYTETQIDAEIRRSLFPTLYGCNTVLPIMVAQGGGRDRQHILGRDAGVEPGAVCGGEGRRERDHGEPRVGVCGARHPGERGWRRA